LRGGQQKKTNKKNAEKRIRPHKNNPQTTKKKHISSQQATNVPNLKPWLSKTLQNEQATNSKIVKKMRGPRGPASRSRPRGPVKNNWMAKSGGTKDCTFPGPREGWPQELGVWKKKAPPQTTKRTPFAGEHRVWTGLFFEKKSPSLNPRGFPLGVTGATNLNVEKRAISVGGKKIQPQNPRSPEQEPRKTSWGGPRGVVV